MNTQSIKNQTINHYLSKHGVKKISDLNEKARKAIFDGLAQAWDARTINFQDLSKVIHALHKTTKGYTYTIHLDRESGKPKIYIQPVPLANVNQYLKQFKAKDFSCLGEKQLESLFRTALTDFFEFRLSLDELSYIGFCINNTLLDNSNRFAQAAYAASELSWYARHISLTKNKHQDISFNDLLRDLTKF